MANDKNTERSEWVAGHEFDSRALTLDCVNRHSRRKKDS